VLFVTWIVLVIEFGMEMLEFGDILLRGLDSLFCHFRCTYN
jgi:hypothetical protein